MRDASLRASISWQCVHWTSFRTLWSRLSCLQSALQRKLELVTNALKAQGSTFSLQLSFGSAAADLVVMNASLGDTSVGDCAAVLASLLR